MNQRDVPLKPEERIAGLERILREIVQFANQHPEDDRLHGVRVLAKAALDAPP